MTTERRLERRRGVYVDTKMNGHGQQIVTPYSVRPLPGAPVAAPLRWEEVGPSLDPLAFTSRASGSESRRRETFSRRRSRAGCGSGGPAPR